MSETGKWDHIYVNADPKCPRSYGDKLTYCMGYVHLYNCGLIEDWGCGEGFFKTLCRKDQYRGVEGSKSPNADIIVDLEEYRSDVPGIFMRHVIEHNPNWEKVLRNALESFRHLMTLVIFTPFAEKTYDNRETIPGYEQYARIFFKYEDLTDVINSVPGVSFEAHLNLSTHTQFRVEHVFNLVKA